MHRLVPSLVLLLAMVFADGLSAQQVLVVDAGGGGDHTTLGDAVAAAASGDTILVKSAADGLFAWVDLAGKGLTIVGDGERVEVPPLIISSITTNESVHLRNLDVRGNDSSPDGLWLSFSQGPIWIEDCQVTGGTGFASAGAGIRVEQCTAVTVTHCTVVGGVGDAPCPVPHPLCFFGATSGGAALDVFQGDVAVYDSLLTGGDAGLSFISVDPAVGGAGLLAEASDVLVSGVVTQGGRGSDGCDPAPPEDCAGGPGVELVGANNVLTRHDTSFAGGPGGTEQGGTTAPSGQNQDFGNSTLEVWPGTQRDLAVTSPLREGEAGTLRYEGAPGDLVGLFWSPSPGWFAPAQGNKGVFHLAIPFLGPVFVLTITAPDGVLELPFTAFDITPVGLESAPVFGQCLYVTGPKTRFSTPSAFTILAQGF